MEPIPGRDLYVGKRRGTKGGIITLPSLSKIWRRNELCVPNKVVAGLVEGAIKSTADICSPQIRQRRQHHHERRRAHNYRSVTEPRSTTLPELCSQTGTVYLTFSMPVAKNSLVYQISHSLPSNNCIQCLGLSPMTSASGSEQAVGAEQSDGSKEGKNNSKLLHLNSEDSSGISNKFTSSFCCIFSKAKNIA